MTCKGMGTNQFKSSFFGGFVVNVPGFYANPGIRQSRSARYGDGARTEEQALSIVLGWMELQHSWASERARCEMFGFVLGFLCGAVTVRY